MSVMEEWIEMELWLNMKKREGEISEKNKRMQCKSCGKTCVFGFSLCTECFDVEERKRHPLWYLKR